MSDIKCDLCKKHKEPSLFDTKVLLWDRYGRIYAATLCNYCTDLLKKRINEDREIPKTGQEMIDNWNLTL